MSSPESWFDIIQHLYLADGSFLFELRENVIKGLVLIKKTFEMFRLQLHVGSGNTPSKTECVFIPKPSLFQIHKTIQCSNVPSNSTVSTKTKTTMSLERMDEICENLFERNRNISGD